MKYFRQHTHRTFALVAFALVAMASSLASRAFGESAPVNVLLVRAHTQEQSGHLDLAAQTWQQVLLLDAHNRDALAGLAHASKLAGREAEAKVYLDRLRQIDPTNENIATIQGTISSKAQADRLQHAAQLAQQGQVAEALNIYRSVWGRQPPDGNWALAYYDTEAGTESGRIDAIGGLRSLAKKYPADQRYTIMLGRILTYVPKTRAEGLHILGQFPQDTAAQQALHLALEWNAQNHNAESETHQNAHRQQSAVAEAKTVELWAYVKRGTDALNANQIDLAISDYKAALLVRPNTVEALRGLGGCYVKAGQPEQAITVYQQLIKLQPKSVEAWRGLFTAQVQSNGTSAALETAHRLPPPIKSALQRDPEYLRSLATVYVSKGQASEAQKTLSEALALAAPEDSGSFKAETQLQYGALLADNKRYSEAATVYQEMLYEDPENIPAWQGIISMQHQTGHNADALATVERMSPVTYEIALEDSGFLSLLASVYQQQGCFKVAQDLLQRAIQSYSAKGQSAPAALQLQVASIYLQQNDSEQAYNIFRTMIESHPEHVDAWKGLIAALHQTNRDHDALAELHQVPLNARRQLDHDVSYQQTVASVYAATGHTAAALQLIDQIQTYYRSTNGIAPPEVDIQNVWLLYNTHDDRDLYGALMAVGGRDDLTDDQRRSIQNIWATWSVRRAGEAVDCGDVRRSIEILNVASQAFPGNVDVSKALAGGYLKAGDPKHAIDIYTKLDPASASPSDYQSMVGAALALPNMRQAELWLRIALDKFAHDPQILSLAARFERARGDNVRSVSYLKASLAAMPSADPANRLAHVLDHVDTMPGGHDQGKSLSSVLDPGHDIARHPSRPTLPSYKSNDETSSNLRPESPDMLYGPDPYLNGSAPVQIDTLYRQPSTANSSDRSSPRSDGKGRSLQSSQIHSLQIKAPQKGEEAVDAFAPPDLLNKTRNARTYPSSRESIPRMSTRANGDIEAASASVSWSASTRKQSVLGTTVRQETKQTHEKPSAENNTAVRYLTNSTANQRDVESEGKEHSINTSPSDNLGIQPRATVQPTITRSPLRQASMAQPETLLQLQQSGVSDLQLQQENLSPLRGIGNSRTITRETDARSETERQLDDIEASYSPWRGGTGYISRRTGTAGFDQLTLLESPFENSTTVGNSVRLTVIITPSLLDSGISDGTSADRLGTLAVGAIPPQQNATGVAAEAQIATSNFTFGAGITPRGFLVANVTGRLEWHPTSGPLSFKFIRDAVKDSQLSYSGLRDPGSTTSSFAGNVWGGVIANSGNMQYARGDSASGYYVGLGGQYITGLNVQTNNRIDGVAGAYWKVLKVPGTVELTLGANFFGMHYAENLRYFTYGQGGYFSPGAYFLANVPFIIKGQYGNKLHYSISGAAGLQAFQENSSHFFPTHIYTLVPTSIGQNRGSASVPQAMGNTAAIDVPFPLPPTSAPFSNPSYPAQSVVGGNYDLHVEISDHVVDRWYIGGFVELNNTRNYASQTVGFFLRYMSRPQYNTSAETTGNFPYTGSRPLLIP